MDNKTVKEKLIELAQSEHRSSTAKLREVIDEVEAAIAAGVKLDVIRATLSENGIEFSKNGFLTALHRIRKKNNPTAQTKIKTAAPAESQQIKSFEFNPTPNIEELI